MHAKPRQTLRTLAAGTLAVLILASGCSSLLAPQSSSPTKQNPSATPVPVQEPPLELTTATAAPTFLVLVPTTTDLPTAAPSPLAAEPNIDTYIAYLQNAELQITHLIGGKAVETRQMTEPGTNDFIVDLDWSPSSESIAFLMYVEMFPHLFYLNVNSGEKPLDLGIASDWAWSPDSRTLAFEHEYELWTYTLSNGQKRQLTTHLGTDWLWVQPVFTPAGDALVAAGTSTATMDHDGNTIYRLYRVPLDGSAAGSYPPANLQSITEDISGRMPMSLRFSPDGQKLALITHGLIDYCKIWASYQVGNADGSGFQALPVPSLNAFGGEEQKRYFYGDSLVWTAESDGLWVNGWVNNCGKALTTGGGPQISHLTLDGLEHEQIAGEYTRLSLDSTGTWIGVVDMQVKRTPHVQILGLDGHLVLDLGEGSLTKGFEAKWHVSHNLLGMSFTSALSVRLDFLEESLLDFRKIEMWKYSRPI